MSGLWGLDLVLTVMKGYPVPKCRCQWTVNPRSVYFETASEMYLVH